MDVSCPQCNTLYEFDQRQVRNVGVTLKCSQCDHLFRLEPGRGIGDESQRRWMVRKAGSGDVLYFVGFDTLHQWIMEGRIEGADAVSRTGKSWTLLHNIGEFTPIFRVVASIADLSAQHAEAKSPSEPEKKGENTESTYRRSSSIDDSGPVRPPRKRQEGTSGLRGPGSSPRKRPQQADHLQQADSTLSNTQSQTRRRENTTPQFRAAGAATGPTGEASRRRKPEREVQQTVPGRPARQDESADNVDVREVTQERPASTPTKDSRSREVQLEDGRFRTSDKAEAVERSPEEAESGRTFGELEFGAPKPDEELQNWKPDRRRWPLLVVLFVGCIVAVGVWQHDMVEELVASLGDSAVTDEFVEGDRDDVDDRPMEGPEAGLFEAVKMIEEGLSKARIAHRGEVVSNAIAIAVAKTGAAINSGDIGARRAVQPTAAELIAGGRRSLDRGNATQALQRFEYALIESPGNPRALVGLGWARLAAGEIEEAIRQFENALRSDDSMGEAFIGIGRAERGRDRPEAAIAAYDKYVERFPDGEHFSIARYQSQNLRGSLPE